MRAWWEIYKKEIFSISFFLLVVVLLVLGWELFLFYKIDTWEEGLPFALSFLPFSFFPLLILWLAFNSYRAEWKDETSYFLLSIPRPGWQISLAKISAGMTFYIAVTLVTSILIYLFHRELIMEGLNSAPAVITTGFITETLVKVFLINWLSALVTYVLVQFSYLVSLFYNRFRGLITLVVYILTNYLVYRLGGLLAPLFNWAPDFMVRSINGNGFAIGSGPFIASGIAVIALFMLGSWMLENQLEV
ncbi:MAG: ABC transporter permease [Halothermotrichaceae bacterium]